MTFRKHWIALFLQGWKPTIGAFVMLIVSFLILFDIIPLPHIIDLATLTGACVVALGTLATGALGNDQRLIDAVIRASGEVGEKIWQLPLYDEYLELMNSYVADMQNSGGRWGGTITAGLFLEGCGRERLPGEDKTVPTRKQVVLGASKGSWGLGGRVADRGRQT